MTTEAPRLIDTGPSAAGFSTLADYITCPQRWRYRQEPALAGDESGKDPLVRGTVAHAGLAHLYRRRMAVQQGQDPDQWYAPAIAMRELARRRRAANAPGAWVDWSALCQSMLDRYQAFWGEEKGWTVTCVEREFRMQLTDDELGGAEACFTPNPDSSAKGVRVLRYPKSYLFTFRLDLGVKDKHGRHWFVDHKVTGQPISKAARAYPSTGQFLAYRMVGRKLYGAKFGGVVLNMVRLPKAGGSSEFLRPTVAANTLGVAGLKRSLVYHMRRRWYDQQVAERDGWGLHDWPRSPVDGACWGRWGKCPFLEVCVEG